MDPNQYQPPTYEQPPTYDPGTAQPYPQPPAYDQGYSQGYGYPQPNAYPGYGGPMPAKTSGMAIASLVLSLLGLVFILPVVGPVLGVIFGHMALGEIKRSGGAIEGQGLAVAGLVIGYILLGITLIFGCFIALIILAAANSPSAGLELPGLHG
jgi:hypothetical protein